MSIASTILFLKVRLQWTKHWLDQKLNLSKIKKKPLIVARKNVHNLDLLISYFKKYKKMANKYEIQLADQWNFNKTRYCMGINRDN